MGHWAERLLFPVDAYLLVQDVRSVLFYYLMYSCMGWILEHGYHWVTVNSFAGQGFLLGPYKPMYGLAPVILLVWIGPGTPWWWAAIWFLTVPTVVEYASGLLLKKLFLKEYWDYSGCRLQLDGLICMKFSLYWALLCTAVVYGLHPLLELLYGMVSPLWRVWWEAVALWLLLDVVWTVMKYTKERLLIATK